MLGDDLREAAQATTQALHSTTRDEDNSSILSLEKQLREPSDLDSLCFDEPEPERTTLEAPSSIAGIEQKIWQDIQGTRKTMFHEEFGIDHAVTIRDGVTGPWLQSSTYTPRYR